MFTFPTYSDARSREATAHRHGFPGSICFTWLQRHKGLHFFHEIFSADFFQVSRAVNRPASSIYPAMNVMRASLMMLSRLLALFAVPSHSHVFRFRSVRIRTRRRRFRQPQWDYADQISEGRLRVRTPPISAFITEDYADDQKSQRRDQPAGTGNESAYCRIDPSLRKPVAAKSRSIMMLLTSGGVTRKPASPSPPEYQREYRSAELLPNQSGITDMP